MIQLYSLRSRRSWALGDLADLGDLAAWSAAEHDAEFVLVNPLHAAEPVAPMEPSPYRPTSRRFANPVYLRVEDVPEVAYLSSADRAAVEEHAAAMRSLTLESDTLDRDRVWAAKRAALELIHRQPRHESRQRSFDAFRNREREGLRDFATWCALAEHFGLPSSTWPDDVRDPTSSRRRGVARRAGGPGALLRVAAMVPRRAARRRPTRRGRGRDDDRGGARPCRRGPSRRRRSVGAVEHAGARCLGRCAAGCVQPTRSGLVDAAVAARSPCRGRLRPVPRHDAHDLAQRRRACASTT